MVGALHERTRYITYLSVGNIEYPALKCSRFARRHDDPGPCVVDENGRIAAVNLVIIFSDADGVAVDPLLNIITGQAT